jgi:hypothetical protein
MTLIALLAVAPLVAQVDLPGRIGAGFDFWQTLSSGATAYPFAGDPLPAGFFCAGSEPFKGVVNFEGVPLDTRPAGILGTTDTIIECLDEAVFNARGVAKTRIRGRALNLVATEPVKNACGTWKVTAALADDQPVTDMIFRREHRYGGNFDANLRLKIQVAFTNVDTGAVRSVIREVHLPTVHAVPFAFKIATATATATPSYQPATYTAAACRSLVSDNVLTQGIEVLDGRVETVERPAGVTEKGAANNEVTLKADAITGCLCNPEGQCMPVYSWHNPCATPGYDCEKHFTHPPCALGYGTPCLQFEALLTQQLKILRQRGYLNEEPEVAIQRVLRSREDIERDQAEKNK